MKNSIENIQKTLKKELPESFFNFREVWKNFIFYLEENPASQSKT